MVSKGENNKISDAQSCQYTGIVRRCIYIISFLAINTNNRQTVCCRVPDEKHRSCVRRRFVDKAGRGCMGVDVGIRQPRCRSVPHRSERRQGRIRPLQRPSRRHIPAAPVH